MASWRASLSIGIALALGIAVAHAHAQEEPPRYDAQGRPIAPQAKPKKVTVLPKRINDVQPEYTEEAKKAGIQGSVILKITISESGDVVAAEVHEGLGHGLDETSIAAARKLKFEPAKYDDGAPARVTLKYQFDFFFREKVVEPSRAFGELRGRVLIQGDEAALPGATLSLRPAAAGAGDPDTIAVTADAKGAFVIEKLPEGEYRVSLRAPGFDAFVVTETIQGGQANVATYRLSRQATAGTPRTPGVPGVIDIEVTAERPPREVTRRTIEKREIERIPGTNGDALRSIQNLPGVARPPGIFGALLIRGSSPVDSQTFIDGTYVPIIYHFGGLSSVVPTELLSKIDFYPGNFSARYGRAMGGIVDAGMRAPRSDGYHGLVQLDLIDARAMFEGPVPETKGKWSFAAALRRSYIDAWLGPVLRGVGAGVTQAPVYYDWQLIIDGKPKKGHHLRTSFYGSDDRLDLLVHDPAPNEPALSGNIGIVTAFQRLAFQYDYDMGGGDRVDTSLALGREDVQFGLADFFFRIRALSVLARAEYTKKIARSASMHAGIDVFGGWFDVALRLPAPPIPGQPPNQPFSTRTTEAHAEKSLAFRPAAYLEFELTPTPRVRIVPGVRLDYDDFIKKADFAPRINARYVIRNVFPKTTAKGGVGVFYQPPQIQQVLPPLGSPNISSNRAIHYGLGIEQEITKQIEVSLEGFYKQLDDQVTGTASATGAHIEYGNAGVGYAGGGELLLKYKPDDRFFGWLAYTLSRATRRNGPGEPEYLVGWDQTHILTLLGSYRLGAGWELGMRFRLVSGNLVTPNVCDVTSAGCDPKRVGGLFHGASGAYTPIPVDTHHAERLPLFHQLDIRVDKSWQFAKWKLSTYLDVQNAYNHQNAEGILYNFNFTRRQYVTGLPILPSIGVRGEL
jgi:TonB family protein